MKPSYSIGAKNGILEQKHLNKLGHAIWLYLWFLDKQPKDTDKVLGGKPITYKMFAESFDNVPRITYVRWLNLIKQGGYVDLLRTPKGYVVTINKPKKWVDSDVSKMEHQKKSDVSKMNTDVSKVIQPMSKNDTSNIKETINKQVTNNNTTDVVLGAEAPVRYGKPEINELFDYWETKIGVPISSRVTANRRAASTMQKKHGMDKVKKLIDGVAMAHNDRYAPRISDFSSLQSKMNELLIWGKTKQTASAGTKGIKL